MLKKYIKFSVIFITLFSFVFNISAYEFQNEKNSSSVNELIEEIYNSKEQYEDLAGGYDEKTVITYNSNNSSFWWPIGSKETEEIEEVLYARGNPETIGITSYFAAYDGFRVDAHEGIDIGNNGQAAGNINVIASKPGEVIYPIDKSQTKYNDNGFYGNADGGGYGNYVKIKHSDGTYTIYAHLAKDSITVLSGDVVAQGQVIGKMGNSGSSTGVHLHFEMRVGADTQEARVDPLKYVDPENPRPISSGSGSDFSITTTNLTKEEFIAKMQDYYDRTKNKGFHDNFLVNADEVYDASVNNNVNPELVVVTAGAEQNWELSAACQYTNNYWGLGITNGNGCNSGGIYDSLAEGIKAYADLLSQYSETGSYADQITSRYEERNKAKCDSAGHGLPGTLVGMQSIYSFIGTYRYNPGDSGLGGCYYLDILYGESYCSNATTCSDYSSCPASSKTGVCEQNDYTAWQVQKKVEMRYDIFGL